jgi:hypothetical protein
VEVVAFERGRILRNLVGYLPITLFAGFIYFVLGVVGMAWLLDGQLADDQIKPVAIATTALVILASGACYVRFVVNRLARSRLTLEGGTVIVRGLTSRGLVERRYAIGDIAWVNFGEQLNAAGRPKKPAKTATITTIKDLTNYRTLRPPSANHVLHPAPWRPPHQILSSKQARSSCASSPKATPHHYVPNTS